MTALSLPKQLFEKTLQRLVKDLQLEEQGSEPYMTLESHAPMAQGKVGEVRLFKGGPLFQLVSCSIVVPPIQLDSHMLFAFMPSVSALPHFTLDSVKAGDHCAFHLDLIPRVDMGANLAYMDEVFTPLTEAFKTGSQIEGLSKAQLDPRQLAIMSPWMLAHRATDAAFAEIEKTVDEYLDHWLSLIQKPISAASLGGVTPEALAKRDSLNKAIIFSPEVDKVWRQIEGLIGAKDAESLRLLLKSI